MPDIFRNTKKQVFADGEQPDNLIPYEIEGDIFVEGEGDVPLVVDRELFDNGIEAECRNVIYIDDMTEDEKLKEWTAGKDYEPLVINRDVNGMATDFNVSWPDGSAGNWVATDYNAIEEVYDGYYITHTNSGKTITQNAVTRDGDGMIINKPLLIIV
jgi:hypothetical protein